MEQSLIDKIKQGNLDEIDKDMITARIKNVTDRIMRECANSVDKITELIEQYKVESKLVGLSCVVLVQAKAFHPSDGESDVCLVVGKTPHIEAMMEHEKGDLER